MSIYKFTIGILLIIFIAPSNLVMAKDSSNCTFASSPYKGYFYTNSANSAKSKYKATVYLNMSEGVLSVKDKSNNLRLTDITCLSSEKGKTRISFKIAGVGSYEANINNNNNQSILSLAIHKLPKFGDGWLYVTAPLQ